MLERFSKKTISFGLFIGIGAFKAIVFVALTWLLIDLMRLPTIPSTISITIIAFFVTYALYLLFKIIKQRFITFTIVTLLFNAISGIVVWFMVDMMHVSGLISSIVSIALLFIGRYFLYDRIGLLA